MHVGIIGAGPAGLRARRQTFETALRAAVAELDDVELVRGHVDAVLADCRRADALVVDGVPLETDLVVDASGRSGRVTRELREPPSAGAAAGSRTSTASTGCARAPSRALPTASRSRPSHRATRSSSSCTSRGSSRSCSCARRERAS